MYSFPLEEDEKILKKTRASFYIGDKAFQGACYLTSDRVVLVGYYLDQTTKFINSLRLENIGQLIPGKTFFLIPNVLTIITLRDDTVKVLLTKRDEWIKEIQAQIKLHA